MSVALNIQIEQGADYSNTITVEDDAGVPVDLTGYTVSGKLRTEYTSSNFVDLVITISAPTTGVIQFGLAAIDTAALLAPKRYVYDLIMVSPSNITTRVVEGIATVTPSVTY
jgi:hypothetical protein